MKHKLLILSLIVIFSAIIRLVFLNIIPGGINNDELHFVMNAKSIFYGFTNIEGNLNPQKLSEVSSLIFSPIIGPLPTNLFTARLPYALIGSLTVLLIYLITFRLTKNTSLALISALVVSVNPWSIYVSRTSFDAPVAIFLYLLTIYLLSFPRNKYFILSALTGLLAFNAYIGTKVIYFPIIVLSSYFLWKFNHQKKLKQYLLATIFSLFVTLNFIFGLSGNIVSGRINELQTPNSQLIKDQVNLERRQSLQIPVIRELLTNKYTVYFNNFIHKYLYNFSTDILFLNGDHTATGSLWKHGYFYYIDAILIIFGILYLYKKHPNFLLFLSGLIFLSPIPEAVRSDLIPAYVFHSSFQFPLICIVIAAGIIFFWQLFSSKLIRFIFIFLYFLSFINFVDIYFFKAPIYQSESFSFSRHILSKYIILETEKNREIYVLTREPEVLFRSYLFYTNYYQRNKYELIKKIYSQSNDVFSINNVHFINHQKYLPINKNYSLIYETNNFDFSKDKRLYISNLSDAGNIYSIDRGLSCQNLVLSTYPNNINLINLNIDNHSEKDFCERYITIRQ